MNDAPRVLVAQLGARRHYLVPKLLAEAGVLDRLCTDLYFGRRLVDPLLALLGKRGNRFRSRCHAGLPTRLVRDYRGLLLKKSRRASETARWVEDGQRFCEAILKEGLGKASAVFAFSAGALELFMAARANGVSTILDHCTAPRDREMALVAEEEERFPGWNAHRVSEDPGLKDYVQRQAEERGRADRILCGSTFVARMLKEEGVDPHLIQVVPLGVDARFFNIERGERSSGLNVLFVGNEGLRKGLGYLVEAVKRLASARIRLRVAGAPGFSERGMLEVRKVSEECRPVPRAEMTLWLSWADVLVLPTVSDTFGVVILEAMAAGIPVIATTSSGGPDVIRDSVDGWVIPPRDSELLAARLENLASKPILIRQMGQEARRRAAEFGEDAYKRRLLEAIFGPTESCAVVK